MTRFLGGCLGRLIALVALVALLAVGWMNRHELTALWNRTLGIETEATPELAARADEKLASLGEGGGADRVALGEAELQSLLEYRWAGFLPQDVTDPTVRVSDGRVTLEAKVATARFGRIGELRDVVEFLPDTASLRAVASFVPLDDRHVALEVHELGAAGIPVPHQLIPAVLGRFRGSSEPGLPPTGLAVPLPPGVRNVHVSGDSLVFLANRREGG